MCRDCVGIILIYGVVDGVACVAWVMGLQYYDRQILESSSALMRLRDTDSIFLMRQVIGKDD